MNTRNLVSCKLLVAATAEFWGCDSVPWGLMSMHRRFKEICCLFHNSKIFRIKLYFTAECKVILSTLWWIQNFKLSTFRKVRKVTLFTSTTVLWFDKILHSPPTCFGTSRPSSGRHSTKKNTLMASYNIAVECICRKSNLFIYLYKYVTRQQRVRFRGHAHTHINTNTEFYVWVSVHHKLIYIKNQRDATWQYVY